MSDIVPFSFESHSIRTVQDENGEPLFVARDVALALGKPDDFFATNTLTCLEALFCYHFLEEWSDRRFSWIREVSKVGYNQTDYSLFATAYGAAAISLAWEGSLKKSESSLVGQFKNNIASYLHGASIVQGPKSHKHKPDAWVKLQSGEVCPVEAKRDKADRKALDQLLRYMRAFSRGKGILVARRLTAKIPKNVIFVEV